MYIPLKRKDEINTSTIQMQGKSCVNAAPHYLDLK